MTEPKPVKAVPEGFHTVTPYLIMPDAKKAIDFYRRALGAKVTLSMASTEGKIMHAELLIGDSHVMLADEFPSLGLESPQALGGSPVMMHLYVHDVDAWFNRALKAGMTVERPLVDQFYGDRTGGLIDPFGYRWYLAQHKEDVPPAELKRRAKAQGN